MQINTTSNLIQAENYSTNGIVWVLILSVATIGANSLALGPIAPAIAENFNVSVSQVMYAAGSYGVGTALSALFFAPQIDRFGARQSLVFALVVLIAAFGLSAAASNHYMLIAAQLFAGFGAGLALPAIYAFAALIAPKGEENTTVGRVLTGWTVSLVAGVALSAVVTEWLHWRIVFAALSLIAVVSAWLVYQTHIQEPRRGREAVASPIKAIAIKGVTPILCICFLYMLSFYGTYGFIGDHITNALKQPISFNGLIAISYGVGFGLAIIGDPLIDRFGARRIMPITYLAIAIVYTLMGVVSGSFVGLVIMSFFWGLVNHFGVNLIVTALASISPSKRGVLMGLYSAMTYFAASVGAVLGGWITVDHGFETLAILAGIIMLPAIVVPMVLKR